MHEWTFNHLQQKIRVTDIVPCLHGILGVPPDEGPGLWGAGWVCIGSKLHTKEHVVRLCLLFSRQTRLEGHVTKAYTSKVEP